MTFTAFVRMTALVTIIAAGATASANAQTPGTPMGTPSPSGPPHAGMMGHGQSPMGSMMGSGHMLKMMFAIADTNGDGALSFEEVMAIHKRVFDAVDANKDG